MTDKERLELIDTFDVKSNVVLVKVFYKYEKDGVEKTGSRIEIWNKSNGKAIAIKPYFDKSSRDDYVRLTDLSVYVK